MTIEKMEENFASIIRLCQSLAFNNYDASENELRFLGHQSQGTLNELKLYRIGGIINARGHVEPKLKEAQNRYKRHQRIFQTHCRLLSILTKSKVDYLTIKGSELSKMLYGDQSARLSGDLDLLVHDKAVHKIHSILCGSGFRQQLRFADLSQHLVSPTVPVRKASGRLLANYVREDVDIECHLNIDFLGKRILPLQKIRRIQYHFRNYKSDDVYLCISIIIFFCDKHKDFFSGSEFGIRCLTDLLACVNILTDERRLLLFLKIVEHCGVKRLIADVLRCLQPFIPNEIAFSANHVNDSDRSISGLLFSYPREAFIIGEPKLQKEFCLGVQAKNLQKSPLFDCVKDNLTSFSHTESVCTAFGFHVSSFSKLQLEIKSEPSSFRLLEFELEGFVFVRQEAASHWRILIQLEKCADEGWREVRKDIDVGIEIKIDTSKSSSIVMDISAFDQDRIVLFKRIRVNKDGYYDDFFCKYSCSRVLDFSPLEEL